MSDFWSWYIIAIVVLAWIAAMLIGAEAFMMWTLDQPWLVRAGL